MKKICKFKVPSGRRPCVSMPAGAKVLSLQVQDGQPCLWAEVDPDVATEDRMFEVLCTGDQVPEDMGVERVYVGTVQFDNEVVVHVYERLN